jgi:hypothetical protein
MEKQVYSNQEEKAKNFQGKFNRITTFLAKPIFQENFDVIKKSGFINAFTSDPEIMELLTLSSNQRFLFLLFKNKKMNLDELKKIVSTLAQIPVEIVFAYELVNDYSMIVVEYPDKYLYDFDHVVKGEYSKLSQSFKEKFPMTKDINSPHGVWMAKEYTLYYHIFNKTEWLKNFWLERLGLADLSEKMEFWTQPSQEDLIFQIKSII